jgi:hypothetical protein
MRSWPFALVLLLSAATGAASPAPVTTWFDAATARELIEARREFDTAELRVIESFDRDLGAEPGRITLSAYQRVAGDELRASYFPSIRRRKWAGPAVTGFRQEVKTAEYRQVLAEVRKLWAADAAGEEVVAASGSRPAW